MHSSSVVQPCCGPVDGERKMIRFRCSRPLVRVLLVCLDLYAGGFIESSMEFFTSPVELSGTLRRGVLAIERWGVRPTNEQPAV